MIYMIKFKFQFFLLLLLLFLVSCSSISYNQVLPLIKEAAFGSPDIELSNEFIAKQEYSFIRIDMGKGANIIMVLQSIDSNFYTWISSTGEKIITYNGKVIKSEGLIYNLGYINPEIFKLFSGSESNVGIFNLMLENPRAFIEQEFKIKLIDDGKGPLLFREEISIPILNNKYNNFYWMDRSSGRVIRSKQSIHPKLPKLYIDYVYKF